MNLVQVFILSIVEGITEFLPVSSTGHLILTSKLLGIEPSNFLKSFEIVIQLGAILAVVTLYFKDLVTKPTLLKKLVVAFIPSGIVGFTLYPLIKEFLLGSSWVTLNALFWGGIVLILIEPLLKKRKKVITEESQLSYKKAFGIGIFQSISIVPGISRAAATIIGGLFMGLDRSKATEFSFLLAIPTMIGATALDLYKSRDILTRGGSITLFVGTVLSFIFALLAVKFLINYVKKHDFKAFGVYRIVLAILFWIFVR